MGMDGAPGGFDCKTSRHQGLRCYLSTEGTQRRFRLVPAGDPGVAVPAEDIPIDLLELESGMEWVSAFVFCSHGDGSGF